MLIIWDFDGVISDSETIWTKDWEELLLSEKGICLSEEEKSRLIVGLADKDKIRRVENHFPGLKIDEPFKQKLYQKYDYGMRHQLRLTEGVEAVFKDKRFLQCIATGATRLQNETKNQALGIDKYFPAHHCFTADMVEQGKPAPDIFLLAAAKMGCTPQQCVVIEDSLAGITAAKSAGMVVYAFIGAAANNNEAYRRQCLETGADGVYRDMTSLHRELVARYVPLSASGRIL